MNKSYIAITIGPIFKSLFEAKRTRAVWAASYFFSWFSRRILEEAKNQQMEILLPDPSSIIADSSGKYQGTKNQLGAGMYSDRMYFIKNENTTKDKLQQIIAGLYTEISNQTYISVNFITDYLNVHIIEKNFTVDELKKGNTLQILNNHLDQKELQQNFNFEFDKNELQSFFALPTNNDNFLAQDAFGTNVGRKFKSITEIATTSFSRNEHKANYHKLLMEDLKSDGEGDLLQELIKANIPVLPAHKYFAVLYADGDSIGKLLEKIDSDHKKLQEFSNGLFDFANGASSAIDNYGGSSIYLGGEDILAFAPLVCVDKDNTKQNTVFKLVDELDKCFDHTVIKYAKQNNLPPPTLSFGIMIAYYKHPLKEVMMEAHSLLQDAKKSTIGKNAVNILFQKHSGQQFACCLRKVHKVSYESILSLFDKYCSNRTRSNSSSDELLSSIIQRFRDPIFNKLFLESIKEKTLDAFFSNFFNENIHAAGTNPKAEFLSAVKNFAEAVYDDYDDEKAAPQIIFTILRLVQFINSTK